jgi:hypothetical protein
MSKSNHQEYLRKLDYKCELIRPINNPITKYDVLHFKRYEYTTPSIEKIGNLIKDNLNSSLITSDIKRKYPSGHPRWERELFGYCVPASFALLFFMDTDRLHPFTGSDPDGENHWWLEDVDTNQLFDLTSVQYSKKELEFVYATGRPKKLYSFQGRPQSRFMNLMELAQSNTKRSIVLE